MKLMKLSTKTLTITGAIITVLTITTAIVFAVSTEPERIQYIEPPTHTTMQEFNSDDCSSMQFYTTLELTDTRNNQKYRVRKMPDNRCWMLDNMKLAGVTLTPSDSNVSSNYNLIPIGTKGTADDTPYVDDPSLNSTYKNNCIYNMGTSEDSLTGCGYLYSWSAATAGTGNGLSTNGQDATGSICPIGWRLPTGTATGEFAVLNGSILTGTLSSASAENTDTSRANWWSTGAFSGSYAGYFTGVSSWNYQGYGGGWWSSTAVNSTLAYSTNINYASLNIGNDTNTQSFGQSVRCILD